MQASPQACWGIHPPPTGYHHFGPLQGSFPFYRRAVPPKVHPHGMYWTITRATTEPRRGRFRAKAKLTVECSRTRQQQESQGAGQGA